MFGAILGDIAGSIYEFNPIKTKNFKFPDERCFFTDDTVATIGIAHSILKNISYKEGLLFFCRKYPNSGYGQSFMRWIHSNDPQPYNSFGNGSAMRVSPIGFAFDTKEKVLEEAKKSSEVSHDHPDAVHGAQATALACHLALMNESKGEIKQEIEELFQYDLSKSIDEIRPYYNFEIKSSKTVPPAIISFLESDSVEDAIRNAISLGGDSDTLACITGGMSEAYYKEIPKHLKEFAYYKLPEDCTEVLEEFYSKFVNFV